MASPNSPGFRRWHVQPTTLDDGSCPFWDWFEEVKADQGDLAASKIMRFLDLLERAGPGWAPGATKAFEPYGRAVRVYTGGSLPVWVLLYHESDSNIIYVIGGCKGSLADCRASLERRA